jgi:hypothetical protein
MRSYVIFNTISMVLAATLAAGCSGAPNDAPPASSDADAAPLAEAGPFDDDTGTFFPSDDTGVAPSEDAAPSCTPTSDEDEPDDEFKDQNCDGIDGDKKRAIFVSPEGVDEAAGTIDAPVKTLVKAIERATAGSKDVYVCNGAYAETVTLTAAVRVFGGYDCKDGWKRTLERAVIAPSKGTPVTAKGVGGTVCVSIASSSALPTASTRARARSGCSRASRWSRSRTARSRPVTAPMARRPRLRPPSRPRRRRGPTRRLPRRCPA